VTAVIPAIPATAVIPATAPAGVTKTFADLVEGLRGLASHVPGLAQFASAPYLFRPLLMIVLLGAVCAVVGTLVNLRATEFTAEAMVHAVFPGIVAGAVYGGIDRIVPAAGAVARKWLAEHHGIRIRGYLSQLGEIAVPFRRWEDVGQNPFFVADQDKVPELEAYMDQLRRDGDSCGARVEVEASGVPVGWGAPLYDRLDADIAHAMMAINAVKGVEIGAGFGSVTQRGSQHGDELTPEGFVGNEAGGILGGISTGQDIRVSLAIKPTSSIRIERRSIDREGKPVMMQTLGRHDPCVGIRATPIVEAVLALVLIDHCLLHRAQCGDVDSGLAPIPASAHPTQ